MTTVPETEWTNFLTSMALTLLNWQKVEDMHYLLFNKMVQAPNDDICSILYYSPPSFEAKRVLVDRLAQLYLPESFRSDWTKLNKRLETGASQRGAVAHYSLDFQIIPNPNDPSGKLYVVGEPRLTPSANNKVDEMKGKTPDKDKHLITTKRMGEYSTSFIALADELKDFILRIPDRPPRSANPIAALLLGPKWQQILRPYQPGPVTSDPPPSE